MQRWEWKRRSNEPYVEHYRRTFWHEVPLVGIILRQLMGYAWSRVVIDSASIVSVRVQIPGLVRLGNN